MHLPSEVNWALSTKQHWRKTSLLKLVEGAIWMWQLVLQSKRTGESWGTLRSWEKEGESYYFETEIVVFWSLRRNLKNCNCQSKQKNSRELRRFSSRPGSLCHASPTAVSLGGKEADCILSLCRKGWKSVVFQMWMVCSVTPFFFPQANHWDTAGSAWSLFQNCPTWKHFSGRLLWRWRSRPRDA